MAMTTARHKVLAYLTKHRTSSAREISRGLKMSEATVRHHLRVLLSDGRLESASVRVRATRGRPEKVYSIPRAALGDNLSALSEALLAEAGRTVAPAVQLQVQQRMEALAKRLAGESNFAAQPIARRLNLTVEKLNQMKYHARWEAGPAGPRIIFSHCPYAAIIAKHPELCRMDSALLEELMGASAEPLTTIREGNSSCVFAIGR